MRVKKGRKIFFYDNGIRNAIINNFNPMAFRNDTGQLWENFLVAERLKANHYKKLRSTTFFWRTHNQQEIDFIEERDGMLHAFDFKWNPNKKTKVPLPFRQAYPNTDFTAISRDNYNDFLG
jgi:predicted AAA+ superfamily ATPase